MSQRTPRPVALTTDSVSINRATVTLQTIRVNDRQMTQSVFKQLPKADLFDYRTLQMAGVVWGWVNYDLDHYRDRNFVFQVGQELRRCSFWIRTFADEDDKECIVAQVNGGHWHDRVVGFPWGFKEWLWGSIKNPDFEPAYRDRWDGLMDQLRLAEQLFIAA